MFEAILIDAFDSEKISPHTLQLTQEQLDDCYFIIDKNSGDYKINYLRISENIKNNISMIVNRENGTKNPEKSNGEVDFDISYSVKSNGAFIGVGENSNIGFSNLDFQPNNELYGIAGKKIGDGVILFKGGVKGDIGGNGITEFGQTEIRYSNSIGKNSALSFNGAYYNSSGEQEENSLNIGTYYSKELLGKKTDLEFSLSRNKLGEYMKKTKEIVCKIFNRGKKYPSYNYIKGIDNQTIEYGKTIEDNESITTGIVGNIGQIGYDINSSLISTGNLLALGATYNLGDIDLKGDVSYNYEKGKTELKLGIETNKLTGIIGKTEMSYNENTGAGININIEFPF